MSARSSKVIVVCGVTGSQGQAVARHLLGQGWHVRGITRNTKSPRARQAEAMGVELCQADLDDRGSLERAMRGAYGVYAVTDFWTNGCHKEREHGLRLAEVAKSCEIQHFVYASAASADKSTGVPHIDLKWEVEQHIWALGLGATVLRPSLFMENLTETKYAPPVMWGMLRSVVGRDKALKWIAVDDIGAVAAKVFADPARYLGQTLDLVGQEASMDQVLRTYRQVTHRRPWSLPLPVWFFRRFVSPELVLMWEWFRDSHIDGSVVELRRIHPQAKDMEAWLVERCQAA